MIAGPAAEDMGNSAFRGFVSQDDRFWPEVPAIIFAFLTAGRSLVSANLCFEGRQ
jgi:hypothetical protein